MAAALPGDHVLRPMVDADASHLPPDMDTSDTVLVDTGEAVEQPPGHFGCGSAGQERFQRFCLRIPVRRGSEAPARLRRLGVDPADVGTVVLTHLHSDHLGTLHEVTSARVVVGAGERDGVGAVPYRLPRAAVLEPSFADGPIGPFPLSSILTSDAGRSGRPTPRHRPRHQGVTITGSRSLMVAAGDAAFSHDQLRRRANSAVVHDWTANAATQAALAAVFDAGGQVLLTHDAAVLQLNSGS